ncbi:hypothetical protein, conserved [Eimeria brunetti]|uniref:Transmembrane protein n=1 Tax=Eimeria brunetti TaxID=51314 RepID=U6LBX2_9EIME|nr:hypothetical protein, conserved [Eimeria brunetti]
MVNGTTALHTDSSSEQAPSHRAPNSGFLQLQQMRALPLRRLAVAALGVASLYSPHRAEAGWRDNNVYRDVREEPVAVTFPDPPPFRKFNKGPSPGPTPVKFDETITYPGPDWYGQQQETALTEEGALGPTSFATDGHSYSLPSFKQQNYKASQGDRPPGGSLLSLAGVLQQANPQTQMALLRHFRHSLARLRTRLVGLGSSGGGGPKQEPAPSKGGGPPKEGAAAAAEAQAAAERRITALASKLGGLVGAAEGAAGSEKTLAKYLLLPFGRLIQETEQVLGDVAAQGDPALMVAALNQLGPPLVRGLLHLEAPESQGASGVLEPARKNCLKRMKELDRALLEAQGDLEGVVLAYPRDLNEYELQREKQLAAMQEGPDHESYIPPVYDARGRPGVDGAKDGRRLKIIFIVFACLLLFTLYLIVAASMPLPHKRYTKIRRSRRSRGPGHWGEEPENASMNSSFPSGMDWASMESEGPRLGAFGPSQQWANGQFPSSYPSMSGGGPGNSSMWGPPGFPHSPPFPGAPFGAHPHPGGAPPFDPFHPFDATPRVTPSAPPMPDDFHPAGGSPHRVTPSAPPMPGTLPPGSPPPSYAEVMGTRGGLR